MSAVPFDSEDNYIVVRIPFAFTPSFKIIDAIGLSASEKTVFEAIKELSKIVNLGTSRISVIVKELKSKGKIKRIGKTKGGYWVVG